MQSCEIIRKPQVLFLAKKQNYVTKYYWHIHQFDLFSKTLYSSRRASTSFAYVILQLLLFRRTQHRGLSKMTNQKFSNVSKAPSRISREAASLFLPSSFSPGIICVPSSITLPGLPILLEIWCAFLPIDRRFWSVRWCQHLWGLNKENLDIYWMPVWRQVG